MKNKVFWIIFGLLSVMCFFIFKDYLILKKAYFFYDICSDGFFSRFPIIYHIADYIALHGTPGWSFKVGMGQNIFPFMLNEPFDIFLYMAGKQNVMQFIIYIEVLKIISGGLAFFYYLRTLSLSNFTSITGAILFAFCGYVTEGSAWFGFTFESFNFALLLLTYELYFVKQKPWYFPIAIFLVCITMPFNLWVYGLFFGFYALFRLSHTNDLSLHNVIRTYLQIAGLVFIGMLLAGPFLLQNIWMLSHSPRGASSGSLLQKLSGTSVFGMADSFQIGTGILRFFSNDILGSSSYFKGWNCILEAPLFYFGLPALLLMPQVFPTLNKRNKIIFALAITLWLIPTVFPFFRSIFWLFAGEYYRNYSFFVGFLFLYYAIHGLDHIVKNRTINITGLLLTLAVLLTLLFCHFFIKEDAIEKPLQKMIAAMLIAYTVSLLLIPLFKNAGYLKYLFLLLVISEETYSAWITANKRDSFGLEWLQGKVVYNNSFADAVKIIQQQDPQFYRIDRVFDVPSSRYSDLNFSQKQEYNSTSSYNSFNQLYYIRFLQEMGVVDKNNESESRWAIGLINNPVLESENSVKYVLSAKKYSAQWPAMWDSVTTTGNDEIGRVTIYRNKYVLPFAYGFNRYIRRSIYEAATPVQKKHIITKAAIIDDKDVSGAGKAKELDLSDIPSDTLNFDMFVNNMTELKKDTLALWQFTDNKISGDIRLSEDKIVYFSVPYDKGWSVKVDVTEMKPLIINGGMMGVFVEKGVHHIELTYKLQFISIGIVMTALAILILLFLYFKTKGTEKSFSDRLKEISTVGINAYTFNYFAIIFLALLLYFFRYKTDVFYGDDLQLYFQNTSLHGFWEKMNASVAAQKYRPIHDIIADWEISLFKLSSAAYYFFNITIQTINTLLFAMTIDLILNSAIISVILGLTLALSRFSLFNISQLINGGPLEGLAMTFFLCSLYFLLKDLFAKKADKPNTRYLILSIVFAILDIYIHERYVVLLPFLLVIIWVGPWATGRTLRHKYLLSLLIIGSTSLNVFIKQYYFKVPFFVGTNGKVMHLSITDMLRFLREAILADLHINTGPQYIIGFTFGALNIFEKSIIILFPLAVISLVGMYIIKVIRSKNTSQLPQGSHLGLFVAMAAIYVLLLAPAVSTVRVEQRWLQAPQVVLIIMVVLAVRYLFQENTGKMLATIVVLSCISIFADYKYLSKGYDYFYFTGAKEISNSFHLATEKGIINTSKNHFYVWKKHREDGDRTISWVLGDGLFFKLYGKNNSASITFFDSTHTNSQGDTMSYIRNFDPAASEVIAIQQEKVIDITNEYLKDSLAHFMTTVRQ